MITLSSSQLILLYVCLLIVAVLLLFLHVRLREWQSRIRWRDRRRRCPGCFCEFEIGQKRAVAICPGCGRQTSAQQRVRLEPGHPG